MSGQKPKIPQMRRRAGQVTKLLKCIANEQRLLILCQLSEGEKTAGELTETTGISQSAVSQHLALLRDNNIVRTRRESQFIFYSMNSREMHEIIGLLYDLYCKKG